MALNHWESGYDGEGMGEIVTTITWILADGLHTYSAQVVIPTRSCTHLYIQVKCAFWSGTSVGGRFECSKEEFYWL